MTFEDVLRASGFEVTEKQPPLHPDGLGTVWREIDGDAYAVVSRWRGGLHLGVIVEFPGKAPVEIAAPGWDNPEQAMNEKTGIRAKLAEIYARAKARNIALTA